MHLNSGTGTSYHDEYTVLRTALEVAAASSGPAERNDAIVLVGPFTQGVATVEFLRDLVATSASTGEARQTVAVWSLTSDDDVDAAAVEQATTILGSVPKGKANVELATPTALVSTADSDEEAREVVRSILSAADKGVRFDRMGVFVPASGAYMRTLREQLEQANIPSAGPEYRTLADSMTGRLVSSVLALSEAAATLPADKTFARETVMALVSAAELRGPGGKKLLSGTWENISRRAGVVSGPEEWIELLAVYVESIERRIEDNPEAAEGFITKLRGEQRAASELAAFVGWLDELLAPQAIGGSWQERASWLRETLALLLPPENRRSEWPEPEVDASQRIDKILSRVGVLDEVEPNPASSSFTRAIQIELDAPAGRRGRFGTGVLVAPMSSAIGLDLDAVFILGLAEGVCPRPIREDTLISDDERKLTNGGLATRIDRTHLERQRYLHAVAAGSSSTTLTTPLGDHRNGRERTVSRWWIEAMRAMAGEHGLGVAERDAINSRNWKDVTVLLGDRRGSFQESLTLAISAGVATSQSDLQLHQVHAQAALGAEVDDQGFAAPLRRGLAMLDEAKTGFNRFTGDLAGAELPSPAKDGKAVSPTQLEQWASCPRRYFLGRVLELGEIERPEAITDMSALDRGSLVHAILEDFIRDSLPSTENALKNPDQKWTDADRERLFAFAEERFKESEDLNRTGKPVLWAIRKEETLADLEIFLRSDEDFRADKRMVPTDVELPFGMAHRHEKSAEPAIVKLDDGREVALRGMIDRVDTRPEDGVPVVLDYKTSKADGQEEKDFKKDPILGGSKLQLGAYSHAAMQALGTKEAYAYYWYASSKGEFKKAGYHWGESQEERFVGAVTTIIGGIEAGQFPPNPGEFNFNTKNFKNCSYCDFKRLCPVDRDDELERAIETGRLVDYIEMREPTIDEESD